MVSSFFQRAALALVLLCFFCLGLPSGARADEAQEVSKLIQSNQLDAAMQRVEASLTQKPRDAQMRFFKGLILTEQGKTSDAIAVFQRLTEDYPELPEPYNNLAVLYASQGEYEKARASLEMAIRTHPSYATAHENLGDVYAKLASQAYDKALQLDSTNTQAQSKLALIHSLISVNNAPVKKPAGPDSGSGATPAGTSPARTPAASGATSSTSAPASGAAAAKASAPLVAQAQSSPAAPRQPAPSAPAATAASPGPAATPAPAPTPVTPAAASPAASPAVAKGADSGEKSDVSAAVNAWAEAWASKDVPTYLAAYSADFVTPGGQSRQQWEEDRRARILGKSSISIKLDELDVSVQGDHAIARFRQDYHADHLSANSRKTLTLVKSNGKWLIQQERSGA